MSAIWYDGRLPVGGLESPLVTTILSAMKFWFDRDYTNDYCLDRGGRSECACGTAGLWNTNWYSNVISYVYALSILLTSFKVILIPRLVAESCLLMHSVLEPEDMTACQRFARRSYDRFYAIPKPGYLSGANTPDIAKVCAYVCLHGIFTQTQSPFLDRDRPISSIGQRKPHG